VTILVGTSGWQYRHWRYRYFKRGTPQNRWFEQVMRDFRTVELNVTFYRLPKAEVFAGWYDRSPADAVITVKASRYLTHIKRLKEPQEPVARLMDRVEGLGDKLGAILLQLPPTLQRDVDLLDATLACFPAGTRLAVEPRHHSWWDPGTREVLERRQAALVWADSFGKAVTPLWRTTDWGYLRMHEGAAQPHPRYGQAALRTWLHRLTETYPRLDSYVYFNNDHGAAAIRDAEALGRLATREGVPVSRYPAGATPAPAPG